MEPHPDGGRYRCARRGCGASSAPSWQYPSRPSATTIGGEESAYVCSDACRWAWRGDATTTARVPAPQAVSLALRCTRAFPTLLATTLRWPRSWGARLENATPHLRNPFAFFMLACFANTMRPS